MRMEAVHHSTDSLELKEVQQMFIENGITVEFECLKSLFKIVSENPGSITLDEFKKFSLSDIAKESNGLCRI